MFAMPDKHSPEIYRASIMQILEKKPIEKIPLKSEEDDNISVIEDEEEIVPFIEEVIQPKSETTKQEASREKLKQHLLKKYSQ